MCVLAAIHICKKLAPSGVGLSYVLALISLTNISIWFQRSLTKGTIDQLQIF